MTTGEQLRAWRETARVPREHLAAEIGVAVRTIQNWEGGHSAPDMAQLVRIAQFLRVSPEEWAALAALP